MFLETHYICVSIREHMVQENIPPKKHRLLEATSGKNYPDSSQMELI